MLDRTAANSRKSGPLFDLKTSIERLSPIHDFVRMCEDVVCDVLREYVKRAASGKTVSDINNDIESSILAKLSFAATTSN
jgi:hypothetical protein